MSEQDRYEDGTFSASLMRSIAADVTICPADNSVLTSADVIILKQILRGETIPPTPIDLKRAANALARSERSAETAEILSHLVGDRNLETRVRVTAASLLGQMPPEIAEELLLRDMTIDQQTIRAEVLKSLSKVGGNRALKFLAELPSSQTNHLKKQLSLARTAISFRSPRDEADLAASTFPRVPRWTIQAAKLIEGPNVLQRIETIFGSTYGVSLNPDLAFEIDFRGPKLVLLLNEAMRQGAILESITSTKMIAGLIVMEEPEIRHSTVRYLVMSTPFEGGVEVIATRTNGDIAYTGEVRAHENEFRLSMRDVGLQRMPIQIDGQISNNTIDFSVSLWSGTPRVKDSPMPILAR